MNTLCLVFKAKIEPTYLFILITSNIRFGALQPDRNWDIAIIFMEISIAAPRVELSKTKLNPNSLS